MLFPVSGVEVNPLLPPSVASVISIFISRGGVSGAFLLLPFQVSVLNFLINVVVEVFPVVLNGRTSRAHGVKNDYPLDLFRVLGDEKFFSFAGADEN